MQSPADSIGVFNAQHMNAAICRFKSFETSASTALADEVNYAESQGVLCVRAAGNDGTNDDARATPTYPANFPNGNVIAVAATTATGALASFSNYGPQSVDLGAPGDSILSTYLTSTYTVLSGTSMASPMVAAAAAVIHEQDPDLTYSEIRSAILEHTRPSAGLDGKVVHPGVLDIAAALASIP
jgi:subtilisin family serine protease